MFEKPAIQIVPSFTAGSASGAQVIRGDILQWVVGSLFGDTRVLLLSTTSQYSFGRARLRYAMAQRHSGSKEGRLNAGDQTYSSMGDVDDAMVAEGAVFR